MATRVTHERIPGKPHINVKLGLDSRGKFLGTNQSRANQQRMQVIDSIYLGIDDVARGLQREVTNGTVTRSQVKQAHAAITDAMQMLDKLSKLPLRERRAVCDSVLRQSAESARRDQPGANFKIQGDIEQLQKASAGRSSEPPAPETQKQDAQEEEAQSAGAGISEPTGQVDPAAAKSKAAPNTPTPTTVQQIEAQLARMLTPQELQALSQHVEVGLRQILPEEKVQELLTVLATLPPANADTLSQVEDSYRAASGYGRNAMDSASRGATLAARVARDSKRAADAAAVQAAKDAGLARAGEDALRMRFGMDLRPLDADDIEQLFSRGKRDAS